MRTVSHATASYRAGEVTAIASRQRRVRIARPRLVHDGSAFVGKAFAVGGIDTHHTQKARKMKHSFGDSCSCATMDKSSAKVKGGHLISPPAKSRIL